VTVTNNGTVSGAEVAQFYLGFPSSAGEPPKVLRGFQKIQLDPSASSVASFTLSLPTDVSIFDVIIDDWSAVSGNFTIYIGSSSRDIRLQSSFSL
jgi:beta-glucosidase